MHECVDMKDYVHNPEDPIIYDPVFREYYVPSLNQFNILRFAYCPWCSHALPNSLRSIFFEVLEKEYNIDTNIGHYKDVILPAEFRTDEWWKKRGL